MNLTPLGYSLFGFLAFTVFFIIALPVALFKILNKKSFKILIISLILGIFWFGVLFYFLIYLLRAWDPLNLY